MLDRLARDIRFALRTFRRAPIFTAVAIATIGLGIAANVTVFSFIDALFLKPLPVQDAGRLVRIFGTRQTQTHRLFSYSEYAYLRDHVTSLDRLVTHYSTAPLYVTVNGRAGEVQGAVVSANYFPTLGVTPYLGRFFTEREDSVPDRDAVAVIGYGLWHSWFGADPAVIGKSIRINSRIFQVVGVAPSGFRGIAAGASANELWIPTMMLRTGYRWCDALREDCTVLSILGRLAPGAGVRQSSTEIASLAGQLAATQPNKDFSQGGWASSAVGSQVDSNAFGLLTRLLWISAVVLLLIGCLNLTGLLMAGSQNRSTEIAMRLSLGAAGARILQQLLTESVLLALAGGVMGLALSLWTSQLLASFYTTDSEGYVQWFDTRLDLRTLMYALALTVITGILFGILPALQCARQDTAAALKGASTSQGKRVGWRILVTCHITLSLTLLVGAGLMARSVAAIESGQVFDPRHVVLLRLRPLLVGYSPDKAQAFQHEVARRLESMPGVQSISFTAGDGFVWKHGSAVAVSFPGEQRNSAGQRRTAGRQQIAPRFFATLRIPMLAGRDFDQHDIAGAPSVTIVSESLARVLWPSASALQKTVDIDGQIHRVVGVVKDSQLLDDTESSAPMLYVPYWQNPALTDSRMFFRVAGDPAVELDRIQSAIATIDPNVPITEAMPMASQMRGVFASVRLARGVLLSAAGLALLLSAIGLYGVLAFVTARRTREIGIRMAVGARPRDVLALFIRQGLALAAVGCAAGLILSIATTRFMAAFLYGVPPRDPLSFFAATAVLLAVALAATYFPARRAARVDPMAALRTQ